MELIRALRGVGGISLRGSILIDLVFLGEIKSIHQYYQTAGDHKVPFSRYYKAIHTLVKDEFLIYEKLELKYGRNNVIKVTLNSKNPRIQKLIDVVMRADKYAK